MPHRLGILVSHPIQYLSPWFRHLAERLDLEVFYAHRQDAGGQANAGFGVEFEWDVPLLEGYRCRWLTNVATRPGLHSFFGCDTPELYELIDHRRFDAFLVFGWNRKCSWQAIRACWKQRVPVLMRGDSQLLTMRSRAKRALKYLPYRWLLPRIDAHLYVGQRNREYLEHYRVPPERLFFCPHFVDNEFFSASATRARCDGTAAKVRSDLGIPPQAFVFLFVGKLIEKKRPGDFVRACRTAFQAPDAPQMHALVVGDGPLRPELEHLAEQAGGLIHFAGFRNQSELPAYYAASDALVLPSDASETWGLVVNEAMACGIPCLVSDAVGCCPDMIRDADSGSSYPVGDVETLTRILRRRRELSRQNRTQMAESLEITTRAYSVDRATEAILAVLSSVTAARSHASPSAVAATSYSSSERAAALSQATDFGSGKGA